MIFHTNHAYCMYLLLQILHADTSHVCGTNDTGFVCDGSKATARVLFKEPVEIQANTSYIACATLKVIYSLQFYSIVQYYKLCRIDNNNSSNTTKLIT